MPKAPPRPRAAPAARRPESLGVAVAQLLDVMAALRTPETGCPWDLAQTYATIVPYTIEEAYEVADAIERRAWQELRGELGDLLFQVVFYARLAEEDGHFSFEDVVKAITAKMIRRHPHVFGDAKARSRGEVRGQWERIKAEERQQNAALASSPGKGGGASGQETTAASPARISALDDVPRALPALMRAVKLQDRAAKLGFDWPDLAPVLEKLREEWGEFESELEAQRTAGDPSGGRQQRLEEELGDMMFVLANVARHLGIDPEAAVRGANAKFVRRFRHIEARLAEGGKTPQDSSLEEMDRFWDEARQAEKAAR